jgi:hypothetical protein
VSAAPRLTTGPTEAPYSEDVAYEVWTIKGGGGWDHPVHVHFEEGVMLSRGGNPPPEWEKWARKDMYRIGPAPHSESPIVLAIRFREFAGTYVEHCHNTQHEDHAMLLRWDIEHPGQFTMMPTPLPSWDGVEYVDSAALPTFRTVELSSNPSNNTTPGDNVTFTAAIIGVPGGTFEYEFQARIPGGTTFGTVRNYSTVNTWVWDNTSVSPMGAYDMKVNVREVGQTALLGIATLPFTLSARGKLDFDNDGKTDFAVWRPDSGIWYIQKSSDGGMLSQQWGLGSLGDITVPGDYDGDGKTDFAVWRPSSGTWFVLRSSDGVVASQQWGLGSLGDIPLKSLH